MSESLEPEDVKFNKKLRAFAKTRNKTADEQDARFFVTLCFQSEKQKKQFLGQVPPDFIALEAFVDGQRFAEKLGIHVEKNLHPPLEDKLHKKRTEQALNLPKKSSKK